MTLHLYLPHAEARLTLAGATKLLSQAGLRLETNGIGFQIAHGRQMLAGCGRFNYEAGRLRSFQL